MTRALLIHPKAQLDVLEIAAWIARDSLVQSDRFGHALVDTLVSIAESPNAGRALDTRRPRLRGLRWRAVQGFRSYLVYYRVASNAVSIIRVLHAHRDRTAALLEP